MFAYLNGVFPGSFVGIGTFCGSNLSLDHESGCIAMCKNPTVLEHASFHAAQYPSYQLDRDMPGGKCTSSLLGMYWPQSLHSLSSQFHRNRLCVVKRPVMRGILNIFVSP